MATAEYEAEQTSFVVTGGADGIGSAIVAHLAMRGHVVVIDRAESLRSAAVGVDLVSGDAADPLVTQEAARVAEDAGPLTGWVNNAAIFSDTSLTTGSAAEVLELIDANLAPAVTGCHTAVRHFLAHRRAGSIVNISSHQAQRPVRGALPYAVAKAGVEGLTRAVAVDHGPDEIRANAVALGSIATGRYDAYRAEHPDVDKEMALLHPLGRVGTASEVAAAVGFLLSPDAGFISGAVIPVDGGRSANGPDPEAT